MKFDTQYSSSNSHILGYMNHMVPIPASEPVSNLIILVLCRKPISCVPPSIANGNRNNKNIHIGNGFIVVKYNSIDNTIPVEARAR